MKMTSVSKTCIILKLFKTILAFNIYYNFLAKPYVNITVIIITIKLIKAMITI